MSNVDESSIIYQKNVSFVTAFKAATVFNADNNVNKECKLKWRQMQVKLLQFLAKRYLLDIENIY